MPVTLSYRRHASVAAFAAVLTGFLEEDEVDRDAAAVFDDEGDHVGEDEDEADENRVQPRLPVRKLAAPKNSASIIVCEKGYCLPAAFF